MASLATGHRARPPRARRLDSLHVWPEPGFARVHPGVCKREPLIRRSVCGRRSGSGELRPQIRIEGAIRPAISLGRSGHSLGHSPCRNRAGQERTGWTTPPTCAARTGPAGICWTGAFRLVLGRSSVRIRPRAQNCRSERYTARLAGLRSTILSIRGRRSTNSPTVSNLVGTTTPDQTRQAPRDLRSEPPAARSPRRQPGCSARSSSRTRAHPRRRGPPRPVDPGTRG